MKKLILLLAIAAIFVGCEKETIMNVNHYDYIGSKGNYIVKVKTVELRTVEVNQNYSYTESIGGDDQFKPVFEFVSKQGTDSITLTIIKNGVVISEKKY